MTWSDKWATLHNSKTNSLAIMKNSIMSIDKLKKNLTWVNGNLHLPNRWLNRWNSIILDSSKITRLSHKPSLLFKRKNLDNKNNIINKLRICRNNLTGKRSNYNPQIRSTRNYLSRRVSKSKRKNYWKEISFNWRQN